MGRLETLRAFLASMFHDASLRDGVARIRRDCARYPELGVEWRVLVETVRARRLWPGDALALVLEAANKPLDENTDAEALHWLELVIANVERTDGGFEDY